MQEINLPEKPPLTVTVGEVTYKMTYGLEMDLRRMLPDPATALTTLQADPFTQDYVVRRILTPAKHMIVDLAELIPAEEVELTSDEVEELLGWAAEHALYFFVKRTSALAKLGVRYQEALPQLSPNGSEDSASTTPSAGPSES